MYSKLLVNSIETKIKDNYLGGYHNFRFSTKPLEQDAYTKEMRNKNSEHSLSMEKISKNSSLNRTLPIALCFV